MRLLRGSSKVFKKFGFFDTWRNYSLRSAIHNLWLETAMWGFRKINGDDYRGMSVRFENDLYDLEGAEECRICGEDRGDREKANV
jgi:hypothetical protein